MEEIAQVEDAQVVHAELQEMTPILVDGAQNMGGIKDVADALFHTKVEEIPMLCFLIQMEAMMLDFGKLMILTGDNATMETHHAIYNKISTVRFGFINGEEIPGNCGVLMRLADADNLTY